MRPNVTSMQLAGVTNLAVLAPIKAGFVVGFETITYVERLRRLLRALNNARIGAREAAVTKPAFADAVGRFDIIHSFRYAIVPPRDEASRCPAETLMNPGTSQLSLNVTYDGGWEPYMRVIYRDIGTLLDALFCNCVGYPGSHSSGFDAYCRWVRSYELDGGLFYTDSAMSLADQKYLARVERMQRGSRDPVAADRAIAGFALAPTRVQDDQALAAALQAPLPAANQALRTLKGLHRLSPYFPPNKDKESEILIRFAQDVLSGFRRVVAKGVFNPGQPLEALAQPFREELDWLSTPLQTPPPGDRADLVFAPGKLQAGILKPYPDITHGCVVLLRVDTAENAADFLSRWPVNREGATADSPIRRNAAFTYAGLRALGFSKERLDPLPPEFIDGMEARAGLLGDLRSNHPDNWNRPRRNWPPGGGPAGPAIDLSTVHVVLVLRLNDASNRRAELHPRLAEEVEILHAAATSGMNVLGVQALRSQDDATVKGRGHFGIADGISQPQPATQPTAPDEVKVGELLLGYGNGRGDGPYPASKDGLLDDGSFLVLRKLRQHVDVLNEVLDREALALVPDPAAAPAMKEVLLEKMMGRRKDGTTLLAPPGAAVTNDFNYDTDPRGEKCPFHSHVRRTHPRDGRGYTPRIVRRGMSYGPRFTGPADAGADRGVVFMAHCASIAEQFEVLQRWIAGGNSSGVSSGQADPFLGVPDAADPRTFRCRQEDGTVLRAHLGDRPFVSLEWGVYLFVPALAALQALPALLAAPVAVTTPSASQAPQVDPLEPWRGVLEDPNAERSAAGWGLVREQHAGMHATPYGLLVGKPAEILKVLKDDGTRFSVCGYGARMDQSIGSGFLGLDPHTGHSEQAPGVNAAIERIDAAQAFNAARPIVDKVLAGFRGLALPERGVPLKVPVDLLSLSETVLAALCAHWFGLPDKALMISGGRNPDSPVAPARCPGHLFTTSRYIFAPQPSAQVVAEGQAQGRAVLDSIKQLLAQGTKLTPLAQQIKDSLQPLLAKQKGGDGDLVARTIAGVMMGFPPTVHGNFMRIVDAWLSQATLWDLQQRLAESKPGTPDAYARANAVLFEPIIAAMRRRPVPEMIWRTALKGATLDGRTPIDTARPVVLGLASAQTDENASHTLMFGGERTGPDKTVHACPGYGMAIGVLLALLSGLLEAGTLRPTGSQIMLTLIPPAS